MQYYLCFRINKIPDLTMDDVYKFMMRNLQWASDREDVRNNMNALLDDLLTD